MSEATSTDPEEQSLDELADSIASNEAYSEPLRRMCARIRDAKREGRI